ncbi:MAG: prepilin-type N-terminal cleavage/methylation domain-containing protein [Candidatus Omnitrophota bacterium]
MNKKGLTLIEILVSMGILVMLVAILYSVFSLALRGWKKSDNMLENSAQARTILERMSREISSAVVKPSAGIQCRGYNTGSGIKSNSIADEFFFIAPLKQDNKDGSDLCEVGYWLDNTNALRRHYKIDERGAGSSELDFNFSTGTSNTFAEEITDLQFEYYSGSDLVNPVMAWDSQTDGVPAKIKITITVETGKGSAVTNPDFLSRSYSVIVSLPQ